MWRTACAKVNGTLIQAGWGDSNQLNIEIATCHMQMARERITEQFECKTKNTSEWELPVDSLDSIPNMCLQLCLLISTKQVNFAFRKI